jgi:ketosteroid isomerase-like protein
MDQDDAREAVAAAGKRHYAAASAGDTAAIDELFADDVVYGHSSGLREGKSAYIERVATGLYRELTIEHSADQIWVFGDTAIVEGSQRNSGRVGSYVWPEPQESVSLDVWCHRDGRWQLLAHHMTLVNRPVPSPAQSSSPAQASTDAQS